MRVLTRVQRATSVTEPRQLLPRMVNGRLNLSRCFLVHFTALTRPGAEIGINETKVVEKTVFFIPHITMARIVTKTGKDMAQRGLDPAKFPLIAYADTELASTKMLVI